MHHHVIAAHHRQAGSIGPSAFKHGLVAVGSRFPSELFERGMHRVLKPRSDLLPFFGNGWGRVRGWALRSVERLPQSFTPCAMRVSNEHAAAGVGWERMSGWVHSQA
jgi:hypothetical protein